jgi:preprotein translocase subunit YajC
MKIQKTLNQLVWSVMAVAVSLADAFAQATAVPAGEGSAAAGAAPVMAPPQPGGVAMLLPMVGVFAVFYFLMIRPQQKRMKEQQTMIAALKQGDEVVTTSGILGTIHGVAEKVVTLEVSRDVKIKILKSQIAQVVKGQIQDLPAQ